jgi:hypothetical protein
MIQVDFDSPITEISDHAKRFASVVEKLRDHYEVVTSDIKERRDRETINVPRARRHTGKKPAELAISK